MKFLKYIFPIIIGVMLGACSTVSVRFDSTPILINKVPFYPQEDYQCGPASLAAVLNYWGIDVTPDDIAKEIYSKSTRGTLTIDMILYTQKKGLNSIQYKGNMDDLKKNIGSGYPVIVLVDYGFSLYQVNHFMVVIGYNEHGVIVNSGKDEGKFIPGDNFIKTWRKTNNWTLLIKPR
ncbi:MAG: peptidase C39 family protein [Nitrospira sp.]|nr:peptidase C39 family protein [Nitrospira sp.]